MAHERPAWLTPYPNMWYLAAFSHQLKAGDVMPLEILGRELVLFRTEAGKAHVVEPYCPHLGAHLGYGGKVIGDTIRCPFHGWRYQGESGKCVHIPTGDSIPKLARLEQWHVHEVSGMVLVWFHDKGEAPTWHMDPLPNFDEPGWSDWVADDWTINATIQDVSENDADVSHGPILHDFVEERADAKMRTDGALCVWDLTLRAKLTAFGLPLDIPLPEKMTTTVTSHRWGLSLGWITQTMPLLPGLHVRTQSLCTTVPIDEKRSRLQMLHRVHKVKIPLLGRIMRRTYAKTFHDTVEDDIKVWAHKIYVTKPAVAKSDAGVMKFRRWAKQFYSDGKPKRRLMMDTSAAADAAGVADAAGAADAGAE